MSGARAILLAAVLAGPVLKWSEAAPSGGEIQVKIISATLGEEPGGFAAILRASQRSVDLHNFSPSEASMQLSIVAGTLDSSAKFSVTKVEVVDDSGKVLAELTAEPPKAWSKNGNGYSTWDERIPSGEKLSISYVLTLAEWPPELSKNHEHIVLRATVLVGGKERTVVGSFFSGRSGSVRG